ncbi:MAG: NAD(P)/FAD-dependent oxidoreductase [Actinobacteria bacterium]|nr:NAD(P)/FAD-dependent oxidoreductase [Actinomycetota bacterium]
MDTARTPDTDTLVIGASAAGLASVVTLRRAGVAAEVLEASDQVAVAWRHHYERLHLHTPKSASSLPGLPMPRDWPRYPAREQVVEYLEQYAASNGVRPHFGQRVSRIERADDGIWTVTTDDRTWTSRNVVVATGATRVPVRPTWPGMEEYGGAVLHSSEYRNGEPWRGGRVLVVGFGNSACEQAIDLVEHGVEAHLSVRSAVNVLPRDLLGVPVLQMGIAMRRLPTGLADALAAPLVALTVGDITKVGLRKLPYGPQTQIKNDRHIPLLDIGTMDHIKAGRITVHGDIARFTPTGVELADGTSLDVDAVVLATGYRPGLEEFLPAWQQVCDADGRPTVSGGRTALPGLYFVGQFVSPSGMLREMGIEAERVAKLIASS